MLPEEEKPLMTSCTGSSQTQNCRDSIMQLFLGRSWLGEQGMSPDQKMAWDVG